MDSYRSLSKCVGLLFLLLIIVWAGGCSPKKELKDVKDPFYEQWRVKAEEAKGNSPVEPPPVDEEPFEIVSPDPTAKEELDAPKPLPNRKLSLKMNNIDVAVLLRTLARAADQNIVLNEKVTGNININIHEAPWDEVFLSILQTHGLNYAWKGDIIRIMTAEDMDAELLSRARKRELDLIQPPLTRIVAVKFSEAEKLKANLEQFVTVDRNGKPAGSILVDEHTNSLIIQAIKSDMDRILAVVKKLDRPTPQVLIEAYIVEANKDVARELGIQWGGAYKGTKAATKTSLLAGTSLIPGPAISARRSMLPQGRWSIFRPPPSAVLIPRPSGSSIRRSGTFFCPSSSRPCRIRESFTSSRVLPSPPRITNSLSSRAARRFPINRWKTAR